MGNKSTSNWCVHCSTDNSLKGHVITRDYCMQISGESGAGQGSAFYVDVLTLKKKRGQGQMCTCQ